MLSVAIAVAFHLLLQLGFIMRAILRPHREPSARIAWIVVLVAAPVVGILAYLLLGEVNIGRHRIKRKRETLQSLLPVLNELTAAGALPPAAVGDRYEHLCRLGESINYLSPCGGNSASLMTDSNAAIDAIVADIDQARQHVHLLFYIWLTDRNGCRVVEAVKRAAQRGVSCRVMADSLGSRALIRSTFWQDMKDAGVQAAVALPVQRSPLNWLAQRLDLRNHRKVVVVDGRITYCGSQNCADPEFRVKPKYAPWVDVMLRCEGPIAQQNQFVFVSDWSAAVGEDLTEVLRQPVAAREDGFTAQVVATGPLSRNSAMPEVFISLMHTARRELTITTPYYVPNESMQSALCAAAYRGIKTTVVFPARNDSWFVAAASRSYYLELLAAGVRIFEYVGGLLHAKTLTLDGEVSLIGSANLDRRSFDLNFENNLLLLDRELTTALQQRQQQYLDASRRVTVDQVTAWPLYRRLWNNTAAMLGPVL